MNKDIEKICCELNDFAQSLKQEVSRRIKLILTNSGSSSTPTMTVRQQSHVSNPERPWLIGGGAALAVGVLGAVFSWGTWSYIVGGGGLASILYGQTKKKPHEARSVSFHRQPLSEPKGYDVAEKAIELSKMVEANWRDKVEDCKSSVQRIINNSAISPELKDSLLGETYTTERVAIDFDNVVSKLESQPVSSFAIILSEYERSITDSIDKAANDQISIYRIVSQKL